MPAKALDNLKKFEERKAAEGSVTTSSQPDGKKVGDFDLSYRHTLHASKINPIQPSNLLAQTNRESFQRFMDSILQKAGKLRALNKNLLENFDVSDDSVAQCRPHSLYFGDELGRNGV